MNEIPTAADYMARMRTLGMPYAEIMKGFAKRHVEAALKAASEKATTDGYGDGYAGIDEDSILNAYPLNLIK